MPDYKVEWFFEQGKAGWSELLYRTSNSLTDALNASLSLGQLRANMMAKPAEVFISYIRVSQVDAPGITLSRQVNLVSTDPVNSVTAVHSPWTAIMIRMGTAAANRREYFARGAPKTVPNEQWFDKPLNAAWLASEQIWEAAVKVDWALRCLVKPRPLVTITAMTLMGSGGLLVTSPAHGLTTGSLIVFYRVRSLGAFVRGRHSIRVIDANTFAVDDFNLTRFTFESGQYRVPAYVLNRISKAVLEGARRRKPGRPFGLLRGRSSTVKR